MLEGEAECDDLAWRGDRITSPASAAGAAFQTKQPLAAPLPKLGFIMC